MRLSAFDFELPPECIAPHPTAERDGSRLLHLDRASGEISHHVFRDLPAFLSRGDCLVLNETRVRSARIRARRATGGRVELLLTRALDGDTWEAMARPARRLLSGESLALDAGRGTVRVGERLPGGRLRVSLLDPAGAAIGPDAVGEPPLPPYIGRSTEPEDRDRYQTVYAREEGAVAAPTAGLHFTHALLDVLARGGVSIARLVLHVGPGTFKPVTAEEIERHEMEEEVFVYPEEAARTIEATRARGKRIVCVGTTSARVLETLGPGAGPATGATRLFIRPPYTFRALDALITNFHLPRSTLLMLVSAFAGRETVLAAYEAAITEGYRFYSYGDAMLIS